MSSCHPCQALFQPPLNEEEWKSLFLEKLQKNIHPLVKNDPRWGNLIMIWHEKKADNTTIKHIYAACIDRRDSSFYLDCPPGRIYAKCVAQLLFRPLHIALKTFYHLTVVLPVINEVGKSLTEQRASKTFLRNLGKSMLDIVRTPLYGTVMMVKSAALLCRGPGNPARLYEGRAALGKIEKHANWGEKETIWILAGCFQPFDISVLQTYEAGKFQDTIYPSEEPLNKQLTHFCRRLVRHQRKFFNLFAWHRLKPNEAYISPCIKKAQGVCSQGTKP